MPKRKYRNFMRPMVIIREEVRKSGKPCLASSDFRAPARTIPGVLWPLFSHFFADTDLTLRS